ncbi:MAG TPA: hypothetical protein VG826_26055 [Pirellulales bacterium]|nr:hypothetical protein [Pirellulales bacterium]
MTSLLTKLKPKRRWLQVSLRTVLVLVTALCVALSMWLVPAERRRRVVAAIGELGGDVRYMEPDQTETKSFPIAFLQRSLPRDYFDQVALADLTGTQVTDARLADLKVLTGLRGLRLGSTDVTDVGLAPLHRLTSLRFLDLSGTPVTDAGLAHVRELKELEALWLAGTDVTDTGVASLRELTSLRELWLSHTQVTDAGMATLRQALPNCRVTGP